MSMTTNYMFVMQILAHVSHGPRQTNEQVTIGWEQSSEFEVAPESLIVDWLGKPTNRI